ncbi:MULTISPECIES: hypothetical protein [Micrococcaceae]|uniref:hypothetical protein n=1 Tax=unclassified Kocuria TaxID=2649579 RepID=UPI0013E9FB53|nr:MULTISPECIES: hypothetical protein [unclassified Kocuria]
MLRIIAGQGSFVVWLGFRGEDRLDRFVGFEGSVVLVIDGDAVEQGPVEHPSFGRFCLGVDLVDVGEEAEDGIECDLGLVVGRFQGAEEAGDRLEAGADAVSFRLE